MRFYALEKLINLFPGYRRQFKIDDHQLLLLQVGQQHFLVEALCPHRQQALVEAPLNGEAIVCPQHHYQFSLHNGQVLASTEAPCRDLRCYELIYEGNELGVLL